MRNAHRFAPAVLALLALAGCSRPIAVGSDPGLDYAVEVTNPLPERMIVYWTQGDDRRRELGSVASGGRERFIVAGTTGPSITVEAESATSGREASRQAVMLRAGETVPVRLAW